MKAAWFIKESTYREPIPEIPEIVSNDLSKPFFPAKTSNMKKILFPSLVIILLVAGAIVFSALNPAPKVIIFDQELKKTTGNIKKENIKFLNQVGFDQSKTVQDNLPILSEEKANYFKSKFGLEYYSDAVIDKALNTTGLILGSTHQFIGKIPDKNIEELQTNMNKVKDYLSNEPVLKTNSEGKFLVHNFENELVDVLNESDIPADKVAELKTRRWAMAHDIFDDPLYIKYSGGTVIDYVPSKTKPEPQHTETGVITISDTWQRPFAPNPINQEILIIASSNEFKLSPEQIVMDHKIKHKPIVRDPMVLLKVYGGYVKLTSWN